MAEHETGAGRPDPAALKVQAILTAPPAKTTWTARTQDQLVAALARNGWSRHSARDACHRARRDGSAETLNDAGDRAGLVTFGDTEVDLWDAKIGPGGDAASRGDEPGVLAAASDRPGAAERSSDPAIGEPGSRYLTLPLETVTLMQAGDYGVSMGEILPKGYISPGSFTNDGRYRVWELAEDIRRNGIDLPLKVYMGRSRPVVWDGQHRYAAAAIARVTHVPVEITYPEDVRDVTEWARTAAEPADGGLPRLPFALAAESFPPAPGAGPRPGSGARTSPGRAAHGTARRQPDQSPRPARGPR